MSAVLDVVFELIGAVLFALGFIAFGFHVGVLVERRRAAARVGRVLADVDRRRG